MSKSRKSIVDVQGITLSIFSNGNDAFNYGEYAIIKSKAGLNSDTISVIFFYPYTGLEIGIWICQDSKPVEFERFRTEAGGLRLKRLNQIVIRQMPTLTSTTLRFFPDRTGKEGKA